MNKVKNFESFINEKMKTHGTLAAGITILYDNRILLVHPTNASWQKSTLGIPKGSIEHGEDPLSAAIREVKEEVGINIDPTRLDINHETVVLNDRVGKAKKTLIYFVYKIDDLSEIGLTGIRVPKEQLQIEEVDWAGFLTGLEAYKKTVNSQRIILDRHIKLS